MNRYIYYILLIAAVLLISSCSSGERNDIPPADSEEKINIPAKKPGPSAEDNEASYSLTVNPKTAFKGTVFNAFSKNFRLSDARIQWTLNSFPVPGAEGIQFNAEDAVKGDIIQATAITGISTVESNTVAISNSKPVISSVMFLPVIFKPGDRLYAEVKGSDPDGDKLSMIYEWTNNLEPAGSEKYIASELRRGDRVLVKITPYDGEDYGEPFIVRRDIQNMPVTIIENWEFNFDGETFTHKVNAFDPDGDTLVYSLETDLEGLSINPETGIITWPVPEDFTGEAKMIVSVSDGFGGTSTQELSFNLTLEEKKVSQEGEVSQEEEIAY